MSQVQITWRYWAGTEWRGEWVMGKTDVVPYGEYLYMVTARDPDLRTARVHLVSTRN